MTVLTMDDRNSAEAKAVRESYTTRPEPLEVAEYARIAKAEKLFGIKRSTLYELKRENKIKMKKVSSRAVLVDLNSVRRFVASLPDA